MTSQDQNIDHSEINNSSVQQSQAGQNAVSFSNSRDNQVVIENTFLRLFGRSESNQVDWDWAKLLLEKKQLPEIRTRLTDTLGRERILMDVSIAEQQQWVNRLQTDRQLQINGKNSGLLDPNKLLIETFGRDDIAGKLLILGAPGSGKTTALLSLAEQLVIGAIEQSQTVIPVILELSTWREDSQSIEAWIIEQLYDLHGGDRKQKIYEKYLKRQVLLPLLDGLDELGLERQKKCTEKLNEFARTYPQLVVCCRVREFETANIKLSNLNGAICLQELSDRQIEAYFQSINRADLWSAMKTNSALQGLLQATREGEAGLLRVPLFIKLLADVYDPQQPIKNKADLLEKYIERQLSFDQRSSDHRKGMKNHRWAYKIIEKEPRLDKTINSLSWVARQLKVNNTVELLIEQMQPSWLESKALKLRYRLILGLIGGLILGLIGGLIFGLILGLIFGLILGLILGLIFGLNDVEVVEAFQIPRSKTSRQSFFKEFCEGLIGGLIGGLIWGLIGGLILGLIGGLILGLIWGLILGLILGLIWGLKQELKERSHPNQGIWNSLQSVIWTTAFSYPLGVILNTSFSLLRKASVKNPDWLHLLSSALPDSLLAGIFWSLFFGVWLGGGVACMQHFSLRFVLWQSGTIPWNLARFLNYCVERRLLLRVGGRYRFLHRELLDHFAQLPPGTQIK
ncbi:MAG: NACHT domain-containing protein [Woronichinia naegeliana WA131]|uniref:NACHT domain-containing protein n=1 Tax=Woronichinia naegeliana WA131 TaxID=2824559 RepID=A0A977Q0D6_9CYAN|nr:MAG: NACHT domain-containing protein [Woronichinia naegeliana WA131]